MLDMRIYTLLDAPNWTVEPSVRFPSSPIPAGYVIKRRAIARSTPRNNAPVTVNGIRNLKYYKFSPIELRT